RRGDHRFARLPRHSRTQLHQPLSPRIPAICPPSGAASPNGSARHRPKCRRAERSGQRSLCEQPRRHQPVRRPRHRRTPASTRPRAGRHTGGAMRTAVEHIMGTAISLAAPEDTDPGLFATAAEAAYAYLRRIDEIFSTYKADSPISRIRDGRLPLTALPEHPDGDLIREVLALCGQLQRESGGAFDAWNVGDPPQFDPSGAVKGWAAENASRILTARGLTRHALNAGGDVS